MIGVFSLIKVSFVLPVKKLLSTLPLPLVILLAVIWQFYIEPITSSSQTDTVQQSSAKGVSSNPELLKAYNDRVAKIQVKGKGTIIKLLKDDLDGSHHQRVLIKVNPNQTLLIAHNIDLAPRIDDLRVGDVLEFYGEYVWNNKGGVLHWTHRDPRGKHKGGWLKYQGKLYQ